VAIAGSARATSQLEADPVLQATTLFKRSPSCPTSTVMLALERPPALNRRQT
jgi:hypothetical protein